MRVLQLRHKVRRTEAHAYRLGNPYEVNITFVIAEIYYVGHIVGVDANLMAVDYKLPKIHFSLIFIGSYCKISENSGEIRKAGAQVRHTAVAEKVDVVSPVPGLLHCPVV